MTENTEVAIKENNGWKIVKWLVLGALGIPTLCLLTVIVLGLFGFHYRYESAGGKTITVIEQTEGTVQPAKPVQVIVPERAPTCSYDYGVMPEGRDSNNVLLADKGIAFNGTVGGPAIVKIAPGRNVSVFPGKHWNGKGTLWAYLGDEKCLLAQYQYFQGEEITEIK